MSLRYAWIGAGRQQRVHLLVSSCAHSWVRDWCVAPDVVEVLVEDAEARASSKDGLILEYRLQSGGLLQVATGHHAPGHLAGVLANAVSEDGSEFAADIGLEALSDLCKRLAMIAGAGEGGGEVVRSTEPLLPKAFQAQFGALRLRMALENIDLFISMDRDFIDAMAPPGETTFEPLVARRQSLGERTVSIVAVLDFGSVTAKELSSLKPGEVLISECSLDSPVRLLAPGGMPFAEAAIGRKGRKLSVTLNHSEI